MKFPYGICDFNKIITKGYFYCDRTDRIPVLEDTGDSLLFLRPRRFGKSLLLSMLANYYDVAKADRFEEVFGNLLIGKSPTELHNKYFILKWDFSCIDPVASTNDIKKSLYNHINVCIEGFKLYYRDYSIPEIKVNREDALDSIISLISAIRMTPYPIYLLIDEYDNFANEVMMGAKDREAYESLVYGDGLLKTLFKAIKASASDSLFDRTFITGVSPVVMSDITSGYNIAENIYPEPEFNDICGFTENEIEKILKTIADECEIKEAEAKEALDMMRSYYNGYTFSHEAGSYIYNPTLALYFLKNFHKRCKYPRKMLDSNLAADEAKMRYISGITKGRQLLLDIVTGDKSIVISELEDRFGIEQMLSDESKDITFMTSFLYYFGILTIEGESPAGKLILKVPNLVTRKLYVERLKKMFLPDPGIRDDGVWAAEKLYQKGEIESVCKFIEQKYFKVFSNRDYRWANELTVKTAFLTLLYNDILYIMDSEAEIDKKFTDLTMIIRPDMRRFEISDVLLEFKFVSLKDAGLTGEEARALTKDGLGKLPEMRAKMKEANERIAVYGDLLEKKYKNLRLKRFSVVSLGFERLWANAFQSPAISDLLT
jgi:hypothetical protein